MNIIGVDYGLKGSICLIKNVEDKEKITVTFIDFPLFKEEKNKKMKTYIDVIELRKYIIDNIDDNFYETMYVECVVSPNMTTSKASILAQGKNIGMSEGLIILACYDNNILYEELSPQKWKNKTGLAGRDKKACIAYAKKQLPTSEHHKLYGKQGGILDGRGDAFCVAYAGYLLNKK